MISQHDKLVSLLTQWDIKQSKKKGHNKHFLGIALNALRDIENEIPGATSQELAKEAFNGRLLDFILRELNKKP